MAFVPFSEILAPELTFEQPDLVRNHFLRVVNLDLPGFVIREAGTDPAENLAQLQMAVGSVATFSHPKLESAFTIDQLPNRWSSDIGLHIDPLDNQPDGTTYINSYTVQRGSVDAQLFRLEPRVAARVVQGDTLQGFLKNHIQRQYARGKVSNRLLVPEAHTASLEAGDYFVFTPAMHAHAFTTTGVPRRSFAQFFDVVVQPGAQRALSIC